MPDWLEPYRADIAALSNEPLVAFGNTFDEIEAKLRDFADVIEPLRDGSLDPGDLEAIRTAWWQRLGTAEIERAKREVAIHRRLAPLYESLDRASEQEWEQYVRLLIDLRLSAESPLLRFLFARPPAEGTGRSP